MAIDEETYPKFLHGLSAGLAAAAAANAELLLPSGADKEMKKLSESIQQIAHSMEDAKARSDRKSTASPAWFRELKGIVDEVDGIMQYFSPAGSDHDTLPGGRVNPKTAMQLKAIGSRLNKIMKKQNFTGHQHAADNKMIAKMSIRNCPLEPITLLGKDDQDQETIVALLLSARESEQAAAGPSIVPIDRKGGAGGTTELARSVFNDKRVQNHFTRRIWVDASQIVDPGKLSELISKPASTIFWVHMTMDCNLEEQEVLLVLDDIRNKKKVELKGSWIRDDGRQKRPWIIKNSTETKRKVVISTAKRLNRDPFYPADAGDDTPPSRKAKGLSAEEVWAIFKERAVGSGKRPELEAIGRDIVGNFGKNRPETEAVDEEISQPTLAELCYHPSLPRCQFSRDRYCGGGKTGVQSVTTLFWKRAWALV